MRATAILDSRTLSAIRAIWRPVILFRSIGDNLYLEAHGDYLLRARLQAATVTQPGSCSIGAVRLPSAGTLTIDDYFVRLDDHRFAARYCDWPDRFACSDGIRLPLLDVVGSVHWAMSRDEHIFASIHLAPVEGQLAAYATDRRLLARAVFDCPSPAPVTLPAILVRLVRRLCTAEATLSVDGHRILIDGGDWQALSLHEVPTYPDAAAVIAACEGTTTEPVTLKHVLAMIPEPRHSHVSSFLGDGPLVLHRGGKFPRVDAGNRTLIVAYKL